MGWSNVLNIPLAALPAAGVPLLSIPLNQGYLYSTRFRIQFVPTVSGILQAVYRSGMTTTLFNGEIVAGTILQPFELAIPAGDTVNFIFSGTGGNYQLLVDAFPLTGTGYCTITHGS